MTGPPSGAPPTSAPATADEPSLRRAFLDDPKTLISAVVGLGMFYFIGITLLVDGSGYAAFFLAMALSYTGLVIGALSNSLRMVEGSMAAVGVGVTGWAAIALVHHHVHYSLAVAAYGVWALTLVAVIEVGQGTVRERILSVGAHGLALMGWVVIDIRWLAVGFASASIALSLAIAVGIAIERRRPASMPG